ncbi:MAG TPA: amino acid adenylation domain-containing protein, partial [Roseiflexaceae bacterium]|nr:amino acid adenylation domain-containing protein [Roseiflexaceae bacterium]
MNRKRQNVEALYPLSPMQQGMLFHTAYAAEEGVYVTQVVLTLEGQLVAEALKRAWQTTVERHAVLRTAFVWEHYDKPFQIVQRQVSLPWRYEDWRHLDAGAQEEQQRAFLEQDLRGGFGLKQAPLLRLTLLRLGENTHRLIWSLHHLLMDGWSLPLVLNEVLTLYHAQVRGAPAQLPPARPYREYIAWLQAQDMDAAQAFWRRRLAGFRAPTPLVVDQALPSTAGPASTEEQSLELPRAVSAALQDLVRRQGLTMSTLVQGAWAILLSRYSGEPDVLFGVTVSGRPAELPGVEQMVGLFINTLPMRVQVAPEQPLAELLGTILAHQLEAQQFEYSPLVEIQGWSEVPRGQPLFESFVLFENYPASGAGAGGPGQLSVTTHRGVERTNYPLNLIATAGEELELRLNYDRRRFGPAAIGRMLGHLATLLTAVAAESGVRVGDLPLLTAEERQQLLSGWNATQTAYPAASLPELFAQQAARTPHSRAVSFGDQTLTYAELAAEADRLAERLRGAGVGPEMPVGVFLERSAAMPVALLAVLKAGGAYLPLDPSFPRDRLAWMLEDSGAPILLTSHSLIEQLPPHRAQVICVDEAHPPSSTRLPEAPSGEQLAYVIYTSGSTGRPKGVMVPHRALSNFLLAMQTCPGLGPDDTLLAVTTLSFDIAALELFLPLSVGAHVVLADRAAATDGHLLAGLLRRWRASVMQATPATWSMLLEAGWTDGTGLTVLCGGEALPPTLAGRLLDAGVRLWNMYGPTETTIWSLVDPVEARDAAITIGRPIANTSVYVLDQQLNPVPVGVPGQLYIGGDGVARGYWNRPELTAERFVPNPFGAEGWGLRAGEENQKPGADNSKLKTQNSKLYKTGDLVRYREDGRLEFLGRTDFQVKLRGFRIELAEIEAALLDHPQVRAAVVALREDRPGDQRLVGYLIPAEPDREAGGLRLEVGELSTQQAALKAHLRERLPEYMIPGTFMLLERFPLTPNGKIDRRALPTPEQPADGGRLELPRTPLEAMLAGIWADVLHLPQVGIRDSFFDLGGHSLLATQLTARARATLGVDLTLRTLFQHPTVAELAEQVARLRVAASTLAPALVAQARPEQLPLSFAQQRMWFLALLDPSSVTYTVPVALRLAGRLDRAALAAGLDALVARHESLRTRFPQEQSQPRQEILPAAPLPLTHTDLSGLPDDERLEHALAYVRAAIQQPFDLERGPLLRAELLALADDDHILVLMLHHIVSDGWSLEVLLRDLHALYTDKLHGRPDTLPPLPIQYADYAIWQRSWLESGLLKTQLEYWRAQLAGLQPLDLPTDFPRPAVAGQSGATHRFALGAQTVETLNALGRRQHVTPFMLLLAVWQTLLARWSGQDDIAVGTPVSNRGHSATDLLIGVFVNTLVLRSDLSRAATFQELLAQVREMCLAAYDHQDIPFEQLVDALAPERQLDRSPLFQVMFTLQNAATPPVWQDLALTPLLVESGAVKFDLSLTLVQGDAGMEGLLEYRSDLFAPETAARMARHFVALLETALAQPQAPLHSLPLLTAEEGAALAGWSESAPALPWRGSLPERLRAIAAQTPEATALRDAKGARSFATLLAQA